jgi:hypothetical protein
MAHTLTDYKAELETLMHDLWVRIEKLGEKLVRADKDLSGEDNRALHAWLRTWWTEADLRAAMAVGRGELDARLFPHGTRNSKVMALPAAEQKRLLSDEKFIVYNNFGGIDKRTWAEMTPDQRNRLLASKAGRILTLEQQKPPGGPTDKITIYESASFHKGVLRVSSGTNRGEIQLGTVIATMPREELAAVNEVFSEALRGYAGHMQ